MLKYERIDRSEGIDAKKVMVYVSGLLIITGILLREILNFNQKYVVFVMI